MTIPFIILFVVAIVAIIIIVLKSKPATTPEPEKQEPQAPPRPPLTDAEREAIRQAEEVWDWDTRRAIIDGNYSGTLPEHIVSNHWTDLYPDIYRTSVAGINFRRGIKTLAGTTFDATLVAEPTNKHDPNAIKIIAFDGRHLGYIPADETDAVRQFLSGTLPHPCRVHVDEGEEEVYNEDTDRWRTKTYLIGRVNIPRKSPNN